MAQGCSRLQRLAEPGPGRTVGASPALVQVPVPGSPSAAAAIPSPSQENCGSPEVLEQIYRCNPILRYTSSPLYAPLLPFPYGSLDQSGEGWVEGCKAWSHDPSWRARWPGWGLRRVGRCWAGPPGKAHGTVNPHPVLQPLAPAATPHCATRL